MTIILSLLIAVSGTDTVRLNLDQAIAYAFEHNASIEQLRLDCDKAQARVGEATAGFYPSLTASGYYAYISDVPLFQVDSVAVPMGQHENYSYQLSLQQVLFAWGKIYNGYRIAGISADMAALKLARKRQETVFTVTEGFYGLLVLEEMVRFSNESLSQLKRHEASVRKRYEAGLVSQFDLLRAQVQVANLKPRVIEAGNGQKLAREGFKLLLGLSANAVLMIDGELRQTDENFDLDTLITAALQDRSELANLAQLGTIARLGRDIARRSNLPTIVGGATYERSKPFGFFGDDWGSRITFNVGFQWPLFNGFGNLYRYRQAEIALKEAHLAHNSLQEAITLEVKQAYFNFMAAKEAIQAAHENVGQSRRALEIIETRYRNGLAINLEYLDAQLAMMQAQTNYLSALKNYHSSKAAIYRTIGKEE